MIHISILISLDIIYLEIRNFREMIFLMAEVAVEVICASHELGMIIAERGPTYIRQTKLTKFY